MRMLLVVQEVPGGGVAVEWDGDAELAMCAALTDFVRREVAAGRRRPAEAWAMATDLAGQCADNALAVLRDAAQGGVAK